MIYAYQDYLGPKYYPSLNYELYIRSNYLNYLLSSISYYYHYFTNFIYLLYLNFTHSHNYRYNPYNIIIYLLHKIIPNLNINLNQNSNININGYILTNIMFGYFVKIFNGDISDICKIKLIKKLNEIKLNYYELFSTKRILIINNLIKDYYPLIIVSDNKFTLFAIIYDKNIIFESEPNFKNILEKTLEDLILQSMLYNINLQNRNQLIMISSYRVFDNNSNLNHPIYDLLKQFKNNFAKNHYLMELHQDLLIKLKNYSYFMDKELFDLDYDFPYYDDLKLYRKIVNKFVNNYLIHHRLDNNNPYIIDWIYELNKKCRLEYHNCDETITDFILINSLLNLNITSLNYFFIYKNFKIISFQSNNLKSLLQKETFGQEMLSEYLSKYNKIIYRRNNKRPIPLMIIQQ